MLFRIILLVGGVTLFTIGTIGCGPLATPALDHKHLPESTRIPTPIPTYTPVPTNTPTVMEVARTKWHEDNQAAEKYVQEERKKLLATLEARANWTSEPEPTPLPTSIWMECEDFWYGMNEYQKQGADTGKNLPLNTLLDILNEFNPQQPFTTEDEVIEWMSKC